MRWIFLSHDDVDHVGNLAVLLELCPRATVLTSWWAMGPDARRAGEFIVEADDCKDGSRPTQSASQRTQA